MLNIGKKSSKMKDYIHFENCENFLYKSWNFKIYVVIHFWRFAGKIINISLLDIGIKFQACDKVFDYYSSNYWMFILMLNVLF